MSLLLFLFYWVAIPVLAIAVTAWLWRREHSPVARGLVGVACVATLSGLLWLAVGEKWQADRQVRGLCAKDGGVRVYETVTLPTSEYDQYAKRNWILPDEARATLADKYYYVVDYHHYRKGDPQVTRRLAKIIRRSDGKTLGESISYSRGGGDLPGPWHESSFICPPISKDRPGLEASVFLRGNTK